MRVRFPSLAGLVVLAGSLYPIPSRTRPLNSPAPMVLSLKAWKSRSLPGLPRTDNLFNDDCASITCIAAARDGGRFVCGAALRRHEAAAVIPRRLFYAPNHSIEAQCLHTRHSGTERSEEPGIHTSDDFGVSACRNVNRRSNLTPYRRPILTPLSGGFWR